MKNRKRLLYILWVFILLGTQVTSISSLSYAQGQSSNEVADEKAAQALKKEKKVLQDMKNLLNVAQQAGFTEEEVKQITIEQDGEVINVWNFVQQENSRKQTSQKEDQAPKRYLTIQDITKELMSHEDKKLNQLRKKLVLSGEKQQ